MTIRGKNTNMAEIELRPRREYAIDVLKAVAIVCVLTIHASTGGYGSPIRSFDWWASLFWGCLTRAAVPLFLMCSGALLLDPHRRLSVKRLYTHNIWRLVVALFCWAVFYKLYHLIEQDSLTWSRVLQALREVVLFNHEFHLYYIPMMILVYIFIPVVRLVIEHASKRQFQYLLLVWFLLGIVYPLLRHYWPLRLLPTSMSQFGLTMQYAAIGYAAAGYYLKKYPLPQRLCVLCAGLGFAITYGMTTLLTITHGELYTQFLEGMTPGVCLLAIGIFGLLIQKKYGAKSCAIAAHVSKVSFCIYLVHVCFNCIFHNHGLTVSILPCIVSIPLLVCLNFALSYVVYLILSHIPVVNRYLV